MEGEARHTVAGPRLGGQHPDRELGFGDTNPHLYANRSLDDAVGALPPLLPRLSLKGFNHFVSRRALIVRARLGAR